MRRAVSRAQIRDAYPGSDLVALELEMPEASRAVGYTVGSDWLGTAVQQPFVEVLCEECAFDNARIDSRKDDFTEQLTYRGFYSIDVAS